MEKPPLVHGFEIPFYMTSNAYLLIDVMKQKEQFVILASG